VALTSVDLGFGDLIALMTKLILASIPAGAVASFIIMVIYGVLMGVLMSAGN